MASGAPELPSGLSPRGRRMWVESVALWQLTPGHLVLLEEACRTADRLDLLDRLIQGFADRIGADPDESGEDSGGSVDITGLLAEARAQQTVLKGMLSELRQGLRQSGGSAKPGGTDADGAARGSGVSDLSARIASRRKQAES